MQKRCNSSFGTIICNVRSLDGKSDFLAQLVEHWIPNPKAVSSSLAEVIPFRWDNFGGSLVTTQGARTEPSANRKSVCVVCMASEKRGRTRIAYIVFTSESANINNKGF